jgi:hypothetical protein
MTLRPHLAVHNMKLWGRPALIASWPPFFAAGSCFVILFSRRSNRSLSTSAFTA